MFHFFFIKKLPTLNGQLTKPHGLPFVRAAGKLQTSPETIGAVAGKVPFVSGQRDRTSLLATLREDRLLNPSWKSTTLEQEGNLGVDGLPPDTEFEEFIAFLVNAIDHN